MSISKVPGLLVPVTILMLHGQTVIAQINTIDRQVDWPQQACPPRCSDPSSSDIIRSLKPLGNLTAGGTHGIRLAAPAPGTGWSINLTLQFETGSAWLTPEAIRSLDVLGRALTSPDLSGYRFRVVGHTDAVGSAAVNKALSVRRAAAVAAYLEHKFDIPATRLETIGMGDTEMLVPTPPQTADPRNRRVQITNLGR